VNSAVQTLNANLSAFVRLVKVDKNYKVVTSLKHKVNIKMCLSRKYSNSKDIRIKILKEFSSALNKKDVISYTGSML